MSERPPTPSGEQPTLAPDIYETQALPETEALLGVLSNLLQPGRVSLPLSFGRYRLEELLGQGGMGAVYRAVDCQLDRVVALKIPFLRGSAAESIRARFLREAQSAAALSHPNICPVFDLGEIDGIPFITMAYIEGKPLLHLLDRDHPFDPSRAAILTRTIALALEEAHRRGVIHRDLKPANVMIDRRGEPVVMDFGLARRAAHLVGLTQQGDMMGTPAYMPPEQVNGEIDHMGPACDIYSLGVLLFELLTGKLPFEGDLVSIVSAVVADPAPAPSRFRPGIDSQLDHICLKALAKLPHQRWTSMSEMADALGRFLTGLCPAPPGAAEIPHRGISHRGMLLRVQGTSFAYRPDSGQSVVTLGRQKRKAGESADSGNDVVLRVPGNDVLSSRISRRHLEIFYQRDGYVVVDRSKAGTVLNGRPLVRDQPTPLHAGDCLVVAEVLTLEFLLDNQPGVRRISEQALSLVAHGGAAVTLEATEGDIVDLS